LKNSPAIISIEGLYLLSTPKYFTKYDEESEFKRAQNTKQKRLQISEMMQSDNSTKENNNSDSFTGRLIAKIINNLQIFIKNVHFR
jgi:vacuolar protein sorting-associated protein 13A/C